MSTTLPNGSSASAPIEDPDFGYLNDLRVSTEKTHDIELWEVRGAPVLTVRFAGEQNKAYWNEVFKLAQVEAREARVGKLNPDVNAKSRAVDAALYPKHVIVRWSGVVDGVGNTVAFNKHNAEIFIRMLPDHIFDRVRRESAWQDNFTNRLAKDEAVKLGEA